MAEVLWTLAVLFGAIALAGVITWGATGRYRREAARALAGIRTATGRDAPDVIT